MSTKNMSTKDIDIKNTKYIEQIQDLVMDIKGNYYLQWNISKEIINNFDLLQKLIDTMLKDKEEENPKEKGEPCNRHRNLAQFIIDEEYKDLTPEEREPDCYADIEFEDALIIAQCWGFNFGNSKPYSEEDTPLVSAIMNAYLNTFYTSE